MKSVEKFASGGDESTPKSSKEALASQSQVLEPKKKNKIILILALVFALITVLILLSAGYYFYKSKQVSFCTQELKLCPDGDTRVSRQGPRCEFAKCPSSNNISASESFNENDYAEVYNQAYMDEGEDAERPILPPLDPIINSETTWEKYSDPEFNLTFSYPQQFGSAEASGGSGGRFISFSNLESLILGVYIEPEVNYGRGSTIFDFSGYKEKNGKYYFSNWISSDEDLEEINPVKITIISGKKILTLNNDSFTESKDAWLGYGMMGKNDLVALINLDLEKFPGIIILNGSDTAAPIAHEDFEKILSTFQFTQ